MVDSAREVTSMVNDMLMSLLFEKGSGEFLHFFNLLQPFLTENIFWEGFSVSLEDFSLSMGVKECIRKDFKLVSTLLCNVRTTYKELERDQLILDCKQPVSRFIRNSAFLGDLVDSRSDAVVSKVVQQVGFLGLEISDRWKFYSKTTVDDLASHFVSKYPSDTSGQEKVIRKKVVDKETREITVGSIPVMETRESDLCWMKTTEMPDPPGMKEQESALDGDYSASAACGCNSKENFAHQDVSSWNPEVPSKPKSPEAVNAWGSPEESFEAASPVSRASSTTPKGAFNSSNWDSEFPSNKEPVNQSSWGKLKSPEVVNAWGSPEESSEAASPVSRASSTTPKGAFNSSNWDSEFPSNKEPVNQSSFGKLKSPEVSSGWGTPKEVWKAASSQGWGVAKLGVGNAMNSRNQKRGGRGWGSYAGYWKGRSHGGRGWGSDAGYWKGRSPPAGMGNADFRASAMHNLTRKLLDMFTTRKGKNEAETARRVSCSWGKRVAVGTGSCSDKLWNTKDVVITVEDGDAHLPNRDCAPSSSRRSRIEKGKWKMEDTAHNLELGRDIIEELSDSDTDEYFSTVTSLATPNSDSAANRCWFRCPSLVTHRRLVMQIFNLTLGLDGFLSIAILVVLQIGNHEVMKNECNREAGSRKKLYGAVNQCFLGFMMSGVVCATYKLLIDSMIGLAIEHYFTILMVMGSTSLCLMGVSSLGDAYIAIMANLIDCDDHGSFREAVRISTAIQAVLVVAYFLAISFVGLRFRFAFGRRRA